MTLSGSPRSNEIGDGATVPLVWVTTRQYLPWCATSVLSAIDAGATSMYVVHDGSFHDGDAERVTAMSPGVEVVAMPAGTIDGLPVTPPFPQAIWLRAFLYEFLREPRVLYVDADTLVLRVPDFAAFDMAPLCAVHNIVDNSHHERLTALGLDPFRYFNSGVMLMDLAVMRAEDLRAEIGRQIGRHELPWVDQDALNIIYRDRWEPLDPMWNLQQGMIDWPAQAEATLGVTVRERAIAEPGIVHFEGPAFLKPWHEISVHHWTARWREFHRRSPFAVAEWDDSTTATRAIARLSPVPRLRLYRALSTLRRRVSRSRFFRSKSA